MSNLSSQRKLVEQLRNEAAIDRKKVSQVCKELISFCEAHQQSDVLVSGFSSQKENPFKEKSGCLIIWENVSMWMLLVLSYYRHCYNQHYVHQVIRRFVFILYKSAFMLHFFCFTFVLLYLFYISLSQFDFFRENFWEKTHLFFVSISSF